MKIVAGASFAIQKYHLSSPLNEFNEKQIFDENNQKKLPPVFVEDEEAKGFAFILYDAAIDIIK